MTLETLGLQQVEDMLWGCALLGTGGGGTLERGLELVRRDAAAGHPFLLASLDELDPQCLTVCPYYCGTVTAAPAEESGAAGQVSEPTAAVLALQDFVGRPFGAVFPTELGGSNTAFAVSAAAHLGVPLINGDPAGRAVPEIVHTTFYLENIPMTPAAIATSAGDVAIFTALRDDARGEALIRAVAVSSGNRVGVADHPITVEQLRRALIPGTLTFSLKLGSLLRRPGAGDLGRQLAAAGGGRVLFTGVTTACDWRDEGGFTIGTLGIAGAGSSIGRSYRIEFRNENMIVYRDGQILVSIPDLICLVNTKEGRPMLNPHEAKGTPVTAIGFPAAHPWRTPLGLTVFGPRYLGLDAPYRPLEELDIA